MITAARKKLLSSIGYHSEGIRLELFRKINSFLTDNKLSRTALAEKLNVSKGYISQVLNGESDVRISKLVQLSLAVGLVPVISWIPTEKYLAAGGNVNKLIGKKEKISFAHPTQVAKMMHNMQSAHAAKYDANKFREINFSGKNSFKYNSQLSINEH